MIIVYTGNGEGKTTAAVGHAIRAVGNGLKACIIHFLKGIKSGEDLVELANYETYLFGSGKWYKKGDEEAKRLVREAIQLARKKAEEVDLLVLDELVYAHKLELISTEELLAVVKELSGKVKYLVVTGRYAPMELIELADLVTEMREIKHPYQTGKTGERGWEF